MSRITLCLYSFILCLLSTSAPAQSNLKPGDIHPNAKHLEFDYHLPFKEGFAVINNGNLWAMIDRQGNLVVPFGKYSYIGEFSNGLCHVITERKDKPLSFHGYIDKTGKEAIPCIYQKAYPFSRHGFAFAKTDNAMVILDKSGKQTVIYTNIPIATNFQYVEAGSPFISTKGIHDKFGKLVVPVTYVDFHQFSDGVAAVAKQDEFGQIKWGYIDTSGKTVLPFQYSNAPGDFVDGLALFYPPYTNREFEYAYMDKSGAFKIKVPKGVKRFSNFSKPNSTSPDPGRELGYIFGNNEYAIAGTLRQGKQCLIDKEGKLISIPELMQPEDITFKTDRLDIGSVTEHSILFSTGNTRVLISPAGRPIVPAVFKSLSHIDMDSGLILAEFGILTDGIMTSRRGYINTDGIFVIVQKEKSKL